MAEPLVPIVIETLGVRSRVATDVIRGLERGTYERVGGVIRRVDSKEIVAWLRSMGQNGINVSQLAKLGPLMQLTAATSLLNLSVTAVGFAMVMAKLRAIEQRLDAIAVILEQVNRKLDLSFYANFRAALDLARSAFAMQDTANRRTGATQAINRFLEAEHHYLGLLDMELEEGSLAVSPFLNTLILTFVSVARCYLELDEIESARDHLRQGSELLDPRVRRFYDSVIGVNPAIYLHPGLAEQIPLTRLTQVLRFDDPTLNEVVVFESLRALFWDTASKDPSEWLEKLPASMWRRDVEGTVRVGPIRRGRSTPDKWRLLLQRLPDCFTQVEQAVEAAGCVEGYQIELGYLMDKGISVRDWQNIELPREAGDEGIALLIPQGSALLADTG